LELEIWEEKPIEIQIQIAKRRKFEGVDESDRAEIEQEKE
jgi:hypothetical protein